MAFFPYEQPVPIYHTDKFEKYSDSLWRRGIN